MSTEYLSAWQVEQARVRRSRGLPITAAERHALQGKGFDLGRTIVERVTTVTGVPKEIVLRVGGGTIVFDVEVTHGR